MFPIFLFILILLLLFGLLLYLLKPSSTEVAVERQLAGIGVPKTGNGENATILKQDTLSSNPLFDLLGKYFPWSVNISRLIQQAGKDWRVGRRTTGSFRLGERQIPKSFVAEAPKSNLSTKKNQMAA